MYIWLINLIVTIVVKFGRIEDQGDAIGYWLGPFVVIDNLDPSYFHLCFGDWTLYEI